MKMRMFVTGFLLAVTMSAAPAVAQENIVDRSAVQTAIAGQASTDQANRQVVLQALKQPGVKELADRMGVDLVQAEKAMTTMSSSELKELAQPAQAIVDHTGGERVIVISLTTLLLGIIVLLLIAD